MDSMLELKKVCLVNLGCHKNQVDAEIVFGALDDAGYEFSNDPTQSDIVIVNTCGFIKPAREESIEILQEMAALKTSGYGFQLVVTGCMADRDRRMLLSRVPEIDQFVSSFQLDDFPALLTGRLSSRPEMRTPDFRWAESPRWITTPPSYAFLKISDGCNNRCTYCRIPFLRGSFRSKPEEDILLEAEAILATGRREIVLISQDNTSYGTDMDHGENFTDLVRRISVLPGLKWLRLMYLYPSRIDRALLQLMSESDTICNYLDIPLQHVNKDVLKGMNRSLPGFLDEPVMEAVDFFREIRRMVPGITLRTTLMTGFPGETPEVYEELKEFVESGAVDHLGVFAWLPEPDTPGEQLLDQWNQAEAEERAARVHELQADVVENRNLQLLGQQVEVVIDEVEEHDGGLCWSIGRMASQAPEVDGVVRVEGDLAPGDYETVMLDGVDVFDFEATTKMRTR